MPTFVVLTGGPGGGKTTLLRDLARDPAWSGRFLALPEAISVAGRTGISPCERLFQRLMVEVQRGLERAVERTLDPADGRLVLCHRGTLDPLAYWLDRGWPEAEFYALIGVARADHYRRYAAVLHLVTAADGAAAFYDRWPAAHRPEQPEDAVRLDRLLERAWGEHPHYQRLDNAGRDWPAKARAARAILERYLSIGQDSQEAEGPSGPSENPENPAQPCSSCPRSSFACATHPPARTVGARSPRPLARPLDDSR
jgi:hypothetical protein